VIRSVTVPRHGGREISITFLINLALALSYRTVGFKENLSLASRHARLLHLLGQLVGHPEK
jgi:hypothetical protein